MCPAEKAPSPWAPSFPTAHLSSGTPSRSQTFPSTSLTAATTPIGNALPAHGSPSAPTPNHDGSPAPLTYDDLPDTVRSWVDVAIAKCERMRLSVDAVEAVWRNLRTDIKQLLSSPPSSNASTTTASLSALHTGLDSDVEPTASRLARTAPPPPARPLSRFPSLLLRTSSGSGPDARSGSATQLQPLSSPDTRRRQLAAAAEQPAAALVLVSDRFCTSLYDKIYQPRAESAADRTLQKQLARFRDSGVSIRNFTEAESALHSLSGTKEESLMAELRASAQLITSAGKITTAHGKLTTLVKAVKKACEAAEVATGRGPDGDSLLVVVIVAVAHVESATLASDLKFIARFSSFDGGGDGGAGGGGDEYMLINLMGAVKYLSHLADPSSGAAPSGSAGSSVFPAFPFATGPFRVANLGRFGFGSGSVGAADGAGGEFLKNVVDAPGQVVGRMRRLWDEVPGIQIGVPVSLPGPFRQEDRADGPAVNEAATRKSTTTTRAATAALISTLTAGVGDDSTGAASTGPAASKTVSVADILAGPAVAISRIGGMFPTRIGFNFGAPNVGTEPRMEKPRAGPSSASINGDRTDNGTVTGDAESAAAHLARLGDGVPVAAKIATGSSSTSVIDSGSARRNTSVVSGSSGGSATVATSTATATAVPIQRQKSGLGEAGSKTTDIPSSSRMVKQDEGETGKSDDNDGLKEVANILGTHRFINQTDPGEITADDVADLLADYHQLVAMVRQLSSLLAPSSSSSTS